MSSDQPELTETDFAKFQIDFHKLINDDQFKEIPLDVKFQTIIIHYYLHYSTNKNREIYDFDAIFLGHIMNIMCEARETFLNKKYREIFANRSYFSIINDMPGKFMES